MSESVPPTLSRHLLITLVSVTSLLVIAAAAVLLALLLGPGSTVVIAEPIARASMTPTESTPAPRPDPTVTITVDNGGNAGPGFALTSFSVTPTPADCGDPVTAATVPLHVKWTSTGATKATFAINGAALPFTLPPSGDEGDIIHHYPGFAFDCQENYMWFTLTVSSGAHSASETIYIAREVAGLH